MFDSTDTRVTFETKDFNIEQYALRWPLHHNRLEQRENRTLLRERSYSFKDYYDLHKVMLQHDVKVLAKWIQRGLKRQKALLINGPELIWSNAPNLNGIIWDIRVIQKAIRYDPILWERYGDRMLMVPDGQWVLRLAVKTRDQVILDRRAALNG